MTKEHTPEEIKYRLSDLGVQIGNIAIEYITDLEKENAELESENQKWKDEWQEQVQKANDEGYARTLQTIQLTKAKEIINKLIELVYFLNEDNVKEPVIAEAEQFLSEVVK